MSDTQTLEAADYLVDAGGTMRITPAGSAVIKAFREAERAYDELQLAWAGACLTVLFIRYPWLQSLRITLTATAEYNDEGGSYRCVSNTVTDVKAVPDALLPASVLGCGSFDEAQAVKLIKEVLDEIDLELYSSIRTDYCGFGEEVLILNRSMLSEIANSAPVSGAGAYRACLAKSPEVTSSK